MSVRRGDSLRWIKLKENGSISVVCGIERKRVILIIIIVLGESSWFE